MSLFSVQARKHTAYYDQLVAPPRTPGRERPAQRKSAETTEGKLEITSGSSACEDSRSSDKSRKGNRTYVLSALSKSSSGQQTPYRGRLTLQRRSRRKTGSETAETTLLESSQSTTPVPEKRLTLQRRTRTPSMGKSTHVQRVVSGGGLQTTPTVLSEPNGRAAGVFRSTSLREGTCKSKGAASVETQGRKTPSKYLSTSRQLEDQAHTFKTPTKKTPFGKIAARRDVFEKLAGRDAPKPVAVKSASLERPKSRIQQAENTKPVAATRVMKASSGVHKISTALQVRKTSTSGQKGDASQARISTTPAPPTMHLSRSSEAQQTQDSLKMENSAVTVAVRVRPFNAREKAEKALQVIYMNGQETAVQHPGNKQRYNFMYDFSFCSVDDCDPTFVSQQTVYKTLAKPLLLRAFEGFNTCLFAYGQTGSGKSYTMMGFGEEEGVIPRFCQELFSRLASMENEEVKCHVEMSLLEVYNEKIHDLLVTREQTNQRRMPLRVREHPVNGPYVADLSANIVSSYNDVQGWLVLGNKQRATAATGMNDKSSRSHSVLTLVMTQTQTEFVEGEEHDHSITSRINLVDLAGSERCNSAKTKQSMTQKTVFIPYRESVLTWLLKESIGGNSKTAMIATISPAGSNVEETLSTLRYAQQARTIINVAKVNEDTSAKLIRGEVEKLRAAQASSLGIEPERVRLFQQEIVGLRSRLCQQEREMVEANRAWREKLEQAEIRKREETKELQIDSFEQFSTVKQPNGLTTYSSTFFTTYSTFTTYSSTFFTSYPSTFTTYSSTFFTTYSSTFTTYSSTFFTTYSSTFFTTYSSTFTTYTSTFFTTYSSTFFTTYSTFTTYSSTFFTSYPSTFTTYSSTFFTTYSSTFTTYSSTFFTTYSSTFTTYSSTFFTTYSSTFTTYSSTFFTTYSSTFFTTCSFIFTGYSPSTPSFIS
ncbi:Kinesin-like protein KIF14 [Dissostichus eleginoides]|uniref:Kinesin-like protein n=1 Tax=Dissostichus eleginoides TaxID=100907 RepID=A0AAD9FC47_DISEL|nr:Kinesin-like protein KIF14 [Dissostichus eleginoides]